MPGNSISTYEKIIPTGRNVSARKAIRIVTGSKEEIQEAQTSWAEIDPISIYEGVDRDLFKGGVAVTSAAENFSHDSNTNWTDGFVESGAFLKTAIGLGAGSIFCAIGAIAGAYAIKAAYKSTLEFAYNTLRESSYKELFHSYRYMGAENTKYVCKTMSFQELYKVKDMSVTQVGERYIWRANGGSSSLEADLYKFAMQDKSVSFQYRFLQGLKIGFAVFCVLLAIADIVMTTVTLVKYYNRSHIPIPHHMVDLSYNENEETSYIAYKSVPDQDGDYGDLNGGGGKQWLALYQTHDEGAGDPILAPNGEQNPIIVQTGDSKNKGDYSPLHYFGKPNSAQNLTFSDGENGWSFNDDKGGIYLFFTRDPNADFGGSDDTAVGTTMSTGRTILTGGIGVIIGLIVGAGGLTLIQRKRKKETQ